MTSSGVVTYGEKYEVEPDSHSQVHLISERNWGGRAVGLGIERPTWRSADSLEIDSSILHLTECVDVHGSNRRLEKTLLKERLKIRRQKQTTLYPNNQPLSRSK
jgi:hypothetical protein